MKAEAIEKAADAIAESRLQRRRLERLDPMCTPSSHREGYEVQAAVNQRLSSAGCGNTVGYKIGCTTEVMQKHLATDLPCSGAVFGTTVYERSATLRFDDFVGPGAECEIAVRLSRDLADPGYYDLAHVRDAVAACFAAIEIVEDRYAHYHELGATTLIADNFFGAGCVLGPEHAGFPPEDLAILTSTMTINGVQVGAGRGGDILGNPLKALAWLATEASGRGQPLREGEVVLLGSVVQTHWLERGDVVAVTNSALGEVTLALE